MDGPIAPIVEAFEADGGMQLIYLSDRGVQTLLWHVACTGPTLS